nr:lysophospholipid acyltransferase 1-like [Coffea arabica]
MCDVYERLVQDGKKAGFFQLLATQTVSAVWHGLYPGYMIFFVQSALFIAGSRGSNTIPKKKKPVIAVKMVFELKTTRPIVLMFCSR